MIRRYIHLKGQACLKQTAEDICKYYITYVLNISKARGCQEDEQTRTSSADQQTGVCMQMEAQSLHCLFPYVLAERGERDERWQVHRGHTADDQCDSMYVVGDALFWVRFITTQPLSICWGMWACFSVCSLDGLTRLAVFLLIINPPL